MKISPTPPRRSNSSKNLRGPLSAVKVIVDGNDQSARLALFQNIGSLRAEEILALHHLPPESSRELIDRSLTDQVTLVALTAIPIASVAMIFLPGGIPLVLLSCINIETTVTVVHLPKMIVILVLLLVHDMTVMMTMIVLPSIDTGRIETGSHFRLATTIGPGSVTETVTGNATESAIESAIETENEILIVTEKGIEIGTECETLRRTAKFPMSVANLEAGMQAQSTLEYGQELLPLLVWQLPVALLA